MTTSHPRPAVSFVLAIDADFQSVSATLARLTVREGDEVVVVVPGTELGERSFGDTPGLRVIPIERWHASAFDVGVALARNESVCGFGPAWTADAPWLLGAEEAAGLGGLVAADGPAVAALPPYGVFRRSQYIDAVASPIARAPRLHLLTIHLGLRPPERTLYPAVESVLEARFSWPCKYWIVIQQAPASTVERARALLEGTEHEIVVFAENRGVGVPRAFVQEKVADDELMAILDDDMTIPPGGFDPMYATLVTNADVGAIALHSDGLAYNRLLIDEGRLARHRLPVERPYTRVDHTGYGCSMMSARGLRAGGFDPAFITGGVDLDFSLTLREKGLHVLVYNGHHAQHNHVRTVAYRGERWRKAAIQASHRRIETRWGVKLDKL